MRAHAARKPEVLDVQARGEYLYAACGEAGLRVFDIAFIDHKGFSERIITAPVSPAGPAVLRPDPVRHGRRLADARSPPTRRATHQPENHEQTGPRDVRLPLRRRQGRRLDPVAGRHDLDGNPLNNFLEPRGDLQPRQHPQGARAHHDRRDLRLHLLRRRASWSSSLDDPKQPAVTSVIGETFLHQPRAVQAQFRYGYVCDEEGIKVLDITDLAHPQPVSALPMRRCPQHLPGADLRLRRRRAEGPGDPRHREPRRSPRIDQVFNAGGCINDLHDVKLGITYVSEFAYLADGKNGLRVVQLTSPETPGNKGFSPRPTPRLIATFKLPLGGQARSRSQGRRPRPCR